MFCIVKIQKLVTESLGLMMNAATTIEEQQTAARPVDSMRPRWLEMSNVPVSTALSAQRIEPKAAICATPFNPGTASIPTVPLPFVSDFSPLENQDKIHTRQGQHSGNG